MRKVAEELLDKLEFLLKGYSNELRATTQPYHLQKVRANVTGYGYHPEHALVREPLMEHIGSLPVVATAFYPFIDDPEVDLGTSLTMLAIHDIGEIITGDEVVFTKGSDTDAEMEAARKLLHPYYHQLYEDIERQHSKSAKFARAIDRITPDIFDYLTPIDVTVHRFKHFINIEPHEIANLLLEHDKPYMTWNPFMTVFYDVLHERISDKLKVDTGVR